MRKRTVLVAGLALATGAWGGACATSETPSGTPGEGTPTTDGGPSGNDGGGPSFEDAALPPTGGLAIRPDPLVLHVSGTPVSQKLEAYARATDALVTATWSTASEAVAQIDPFTGVLTARGDVGGEVVVTAESAGRRATLTVVVDAAFADNAGAVSASDISILRAGGALSHDPAFRVLYPYDATVFPRGLQPPTLQLGGAGVDALRVEVTSKHLTYEAFFSGSNPVRATLAADRWKSIVGSAGGSDRVSVSITKLAAGLATGPVRETWTIAEGALRGTVYYSTYASPQVGGTGALLKVRPGAGANAEVFISTCTVCHAVSANGNTVVAGTGFANGNPIESGSYKIGSGSAPQKGYSEALGRFAFGGLTPDGTYVMSNATAPGGIRGLAGSTGSSLYATASGQKVTAPGFDGVVANAQMPSFSPDGKMIVFNDRDVSAGHTLSVMTFDQATRTFGGRAQVVNDPAQLLAWPAFLPDTAAAVYHAGSDFGTEHATADIELVDVATKTRARLPALNGFLGNGGGGADAGLGNTYLPYGETAEGHLNYEPTVLPVAVGGYYWVVFTSRRCFGNSITPSTDPYAELSSRKKLWVAAIDQTGTPGADRSHPAFYLPGQDLATGNMRGFWALDPCKGNGAGCETGDECCGGYCPSSTTDAGPARVCASNPQGCANDLEKCSASADCCGVSLGYSCVNGRCAAPPPK